MVTLARYRGTVVTMMAVITMSSILRSVAHLSSEMRTQHVIVQEMEQIRQEIQQIKLNRYTGGRGGLKLSKINR